MHPTQQGNSQAGHSPREHAGMCDASGAVLVGESHFLVANDEDNVLRVYRHDVSEGPVLSLDWTANLGIAADDEHPESDIEAAARNGDLVYWLTSHGANKEGKKRPNRRRFFATKVAVRDGHIEMTPVGTPYRRLIEDLDADPRFARFQFANAGKKPPESEGGLNIEGLAVTPSNSLLIAFRNPVPEGQALLIPLFNPDEVLTAGQQPKFGNPILLDLGNRGVRSIEYVPALRAYVIVAGSFGDGGTSQLFRWSGAAAELPVPSSHANFAGLNPEVLMASESRPDLLVLSDDGGQSHAGVQCKDAPPAQRKFRSLWVNF